MVHQENSMTAINHAFRGTNKTYTRCEFCPSMFLTTGLKLHMTKMHSSLSSIEKLGWVEVPRNSRSIQSPRPEVTTTTARRDSQGEKRSPVTSTGTATTSQQGKQKKGSGMDRPATATRGGGYDTPARTYVEVSGPSNNNQKSGPSNCNQRDLVVNDDGPDDMHSSALSKGAPPLLKKKIRPTTVEEDEPDPTTLFVGYDASTKQYRRLDDDSARLTEQEQADRNAGFWPREQRLLTTRPSAAFGKLLKAQAEPAARAAAAKQAQEREREWEREQKRKVDAEPRVGKGRPPPTKPTETRQQAESETDSGTGMTSGVPKAPWRYGPPEPSVPPIPVEVHRGAAEVQVVDSEDYGRLVGHFHKGAYFRHHSWREIVQPITLSLLRECVSATEIIASRAIAALQLLPGLVMHCRGLRGKKVWSPAQLLREINGAPNKAQEIIRIARSWVPQLRVMPTEWPSPTLENLRARVESLAAESRLSAAATALKIMDGVIKGVPQPPQASPEYLAERIAALHPEANEDDTLPDAAEDPPLDDCLQLTPDQVRQRFYTIQKKNTAAGNTGWSNEWLRMIGDDRNIPNYIHTETPPNALHVAFTNFFNKILQGRIVGEGRELLVTARLIMIPKPQGGLRPIRIECAMMRLMSATAAALARVVVSPLLRPIQLGGGLKCGVEIGARLLDAAYEREDAIISVDIANAFNTTRHRYIWDALAEKLPGILRYFRMKHEMPAKMIGNDGAVIAWTRTGVGQGDPWAGLFFEVAVHPALLELAQAVKTVEARLNREKPEEPVVYPGAVSAYEDDTQIRGEPKVMFRVAPLIEGIFANHGFTVNVSKSKITGRRIEGMYDLPEGFTVEAEGMIALGVPVGDNYYRRRVTEKLIETMEPPLEALRLLRPRTAMQLLMNCINPQPAFLLRTAPDLGVTTRAASKFDAKMVTAIADVFQLEASADLADRMYLPLRMGGFGITRHNGMASEKNQIHSRTIYTAFIATYYPNELEATQQHFDMSVVRLGEIEGVADATEITAVMMDTLTVKNCNTVLAEGIRKVQKASFSKMHAEAVDLGFFSKAAWLLSSATSTAAYLSSGVALEHDRYFPPGDFRCAGRNTLGYGPVNAHEGQKRTCGGCRREYTILQEPFHGMSCAGTKGFRNKRHNDIRDLLHRLLKKRYPQLNLDTLRLEEIIGFEEDGSGVKADIVWQCEAEKVIIDIMVIDVGCLKYVTAAVKGHLTVGRSALHAEGGKRARYKKVVTPAKLNDNSVIPFIVEASGRLGPAALGLVNRICGTQTYIKSTFLRELSMITARYMGRMLKATRDQYHDV